jgi:hypothetical protein
MTFLTAYLNWLRFEQTVIGGLVFCDWYEENGGSQEHADSWREWLRTGVSGLTSELQRLVNAESVDMNRKIRRVRKRAVHV